MIASLSPRELHPFGYDWIIKDEDNWYKVSELNGIYYLELGNSPFEPDYDLCS